ncbi:SUF system NifU family Fe-S cluster assembly protein [Candidatus Peregrinibacteria bacterium CG10_big_fil_rev_8_21_14_0_10_49_24]|nr:MAG: SUF system NifU family Fe-S cluster assembly protein [Candidatus Peregrinibacteria bacterium CG11_big_fil_rev_8_21_14_0_20_49_14]PIR51491.1 MAG: SUF system NifU family Fe-S cluster assembly protein [Candidatus Peregrinibacteria bacterium CG10_big_fil_rev_8_21_14_0_10_49_24]PJA67866.1 MAG: SUF system NifU family Fe-S cluster assembly protein [Candidatus Peregrinibacteria bacterium CG_4_9_14_3_um_filter_49_12]
MDLYAENILDHYRDPRHKGVLANADITHSEANISCGDEVTLHIRIEDNRIADIAWEGTGCAISQAGISILCEELHGMSVHDATALTKEDIYELLGIPVGPRRFKCALLCLHTLKNALHICEGEPVQDWLQTVEIEDE